MHDAVCAPPRSPPPWLQLGSHPRGSPPRFTLAQARKLNEKLVANSMAKALKVPRASVAVAGVAEATAAPTEVSLALDSATAKSFEGAARNDMLAAMAAKLGVPPEQLRLVQNEVSTVDGKKRRLVRLRVLDESGGEAADGTGGGQIAEAVVPKWRAQPKESAKEMGQVMTHTLDVKAKHVYVHSVAQGQAPVVVSLVIQRVGQQASAADFGEGGKHGRLTSLVAARLDVAPQELRVVSIANLHSGSKKAGEKIKRKTVPAPPPQPAPGPRAAAALPARDLCRA